jgi:glycosyltransferase involved in cell wall biosynthesis
MADCRQRPATCPLSPLRILFVQHAVGPGGSAVSLRYLVRGLIERGHDVHVVVNAAAVAMVDFYTRTGATVHPLEALPVFLHTTAAHVSPMRPRAVIATLRMLRRYPKSRASLRALVAKVAPNIVHLNSVTLAPTALALQGCGVPIIWHVRESPPFGRRGLRTAILRLGLQRLAAETIFISKYDRATWADDRFGCVVYNCATEPPRVNPEHLDELRRSLDLGHDDRVILFMGGLQEIKGMGPLCDALPLVSQAVPDARLVVLGADEHPPASRLAALARTYGPYVGLQPQHLRFLRQLRAPTLCDLVRLLPSVENIGDYLSLCDLVVFPSLRPHFARPIIEAALCGKPAVASRLGGIEEVVRDGETGVLVPPNEPLPLAAALAKLLRNRGECRGLGERARNLAADVFSVQRHLDAVEATYARVIQAAAAPRARQSS